MALAAPAAAAAQESPSLRLLAADRDLEVAPADAMNLGLWVAAGGRDFVIRAQRPGYGRWKAVQVDPSSGEVLRTIPPKRIDDGSGLERFLEVRFLDSDKRVAGRRTLSFCPASTERVDPEGPRTPTYPGFCQSGFPFVRGALWAIDRGWAGAATDSFGQDGPRLRLAPGRYEVRASIRAPYRRLFDVTADAAVVRLRVRVVRPSRRNERRAREAPVRAGGSSRPVESGRSERSGRTAASHPTADAAVVAKPDPATLPDLVALPPWEVHTEEERNRDLLRFAGSPWNAGPGALLVEGFRRPDRDSMRAVQSFVDAAGNVTATAPAGEFAFHRAAGHDHWHFLQFVTYRVVRAADEEVVRSAKQSFCLAATDPVDLTVPGAELMPDFVGLGSACGDDRSLWLRQALPAGWADTYRSFLPGQSFDITRVPNGRYRLEMRVNPEGHLQEKTTANNVARRRVVLGGERGRRTVRVARWNGIRD